MHDTWQHPSQRLQDVGSAATPWRDDTSLRHADTAVALLQEAAVKEDLPAPAERNPAAVKYTGNLVSSPHLNYLQ